LRIYNNFDCNVAVSGSLVGNFSIEKLDVLHINYSSIKVNETDVLSINLHPTCELKMSTLKQHVFIDKGKVRIFMNLYQPTFAHLQTAAVQMYLFHLRFRHI